MIKEKELPEGWELLSIEDFAEVVTGGTPSTKKKEYWNEGKIPWLNSGELNQGIIKHSSNFITEEGYRNSVAKMMPLDSVLIALTGATTGIAGLLKIEACANQSVTGIFPSERHEPKYLYYYLKLIRNRVMDKSFGGAQKHINQKFVKELKVPLPSPETQKKIVSILEKGEKAKHLRKEADELTKDYLNSVFLEMFGDPVINPNGWETKKLRTICKDIFGGGTPSKSNPDYYTGKIPWVTPKDMKFDFIKNSIDRITEQAIDESSTKKVPKDSLLMVIRSGILKKKLPVGINVHEVTMNQDMKAYVFNQKIVLPLFMLYFFKQYQNFLLSKVRSVTADNLEFKQLKETDVYIPPIDLQNKFAEIVKQVEQMKQSQSTSRQQLSNLFDSLMQKAFKGELAC